MARTRKQGGHVRQLKSGKWQAMVFTDWGMRSTGGTHATEALARKALRSAAVEVDRGTFVVARRTSPMFGQYAAQELGVRDVRPRTLAGYLALLNTALAPFAMVPLDKITPGLVKWWWANQTDHVVRRRNAYFLLRSVLAAAVEEGLVEKQPCSIKNAGRDVAIPRPEYSVADVDRVITAIDPQHRVPIEVAFSASLRLGELLGLNVDDYDRAGHLAITKAADLNGRLAETKTGQHRVVTLLHRGREALDEYLGDLPASDQPIFVGERGGRLPRATLRRAWDAACGAIGLAGFHLHDLRHVSLTEASRAGLGVKDIQKRGGHASIQAAMRYQHSGLERQDEAAALIDARLSLPDS